MEQGLKLERIKLWEKCFIAKNKEQLKQLRGETK